MMTNRLFGVVSARTRADGTWAESAARWLVNLGLVLFVALEVLAGTRHGALVMGLGMLLGIGTLGRRLLADGSGST